MPGPAIVVEHSSKVFGEGRSAVRALSDVTMTVDTGEFVALTGPSGSGKSTLFHLIAGLDRPSSGTVSVLGRPLHELSEDARCDIRLRHIGIVFQAYNLLPMLTAVENVTLPLELRGVRRSEALARASSMLDRVAIPAAARERRPAELSGGEQQRVAIARALVPAPAILLADEPTGSLDSQAGHAVLDLLRTFNAEWTLTVVMATHSTHAARHAHRGIALRDGHLVESEGLRAVGAVT